MSLTVVKGLQSEIFVPITPPSVWAPVTKELKDMEGRVIGDIWYIEHWSFWLDIYIIYKTVRNAIHGEKNAY